MNKIVCPSCKETFKVDETNYAQIQKQVRDNEFDKEVKIHLDQKLEISNAEKKSTIDKVKIEHEMVIKDLESKLDKSEIIKSNEVKEIQSKLDKSEIIKQNALNELINKNLKQISEYEKVINLRGQELSTEKDKSRERLDAKNNEIKILGETITMMKEFKAKQSSKMIGETLEQHCETEFNKIRATSFPMAYFKKDNDSSSGTKGDYIFRECDDDGNEFISIMFEMKNEGDETSTKKKNRDFLQKLDKDRNDKKCEFAVLVSLLEPDDQYYNQGIVDLSYDYPNMYAIRPQFFITFISIIRELAKKSMKYKKQLIEHENRDIDAKNFQDKFDKFKVGFGKNIKTASKQFKNAIVEIDKSIDHLEKTKSALFSSVNSLKHSDKKLEELTIKKLTYNNPTIKAKFDEVENVK